MRGRLRLWRHLLVLLSIGLCAAFARFGLIGAGAHDERFDAKQISVLRDGDNGLRIREVVDEDFGNQRRHGYERIIPNDFGVPKAVTATSPNANADVQVAADTIGGVPATRIRLGDPKTTYQNQHRYVLTYVLPNARLTSQRLQLNIIGPGEKFETGRFDVVISGLVLAGAQCYVGSQGATGGCSLTSEGADYRVEFTPLHKGDGVTIDAMITAYSTPALPAEPPRPTYRPDHRRQIALAMVPLGLAAALIVLVIASIRGRNEVFIGGPAEAAYGSQSTGTNATGGPLQAPPPMPVTLVSDARLRRLATTEFVPPKGIDPWQGAVLLRERIGDDTVAAWFSSLAANEAITLRQDGRSLIVGIGRRRGELDPSNSAIVDQFMRGRLELKLGTYDPSFAAVWNAVKIRQAHAITESGWWKRRAPHPGRAAGINAFSAVVIVAAFVIAIGGALASAASGIIQSMPVAIAFGVIVPALAAYGCYATLLPVRSATGSSLALLTESFRRFLAASEGPHVEWAWQHGLLREYSAWAVALGAADAWGAALSRSNVPPQDYVSVNPLLVYSMHSSFSSSHTAPSSSGGGGGGGGGGVGGGGGGGSSGSW